MIVTLLRHGRTADNAAGRYQGRRDTPLSPEGRAELIAADFAPAEVYVTPLCRTKQTAAVLFPAARLVEVPGLREMDFGSFEGRSAREMEQDADYRAWVDSGCESRCPGGEDKAAFTARTCAAFAALLDAAQEAAARELVIVAHGGTQMAVMERFALPRRPYYAWCAPAAGGYRLDAADWPRRRCLRLLEPVRYTRGREAAPCR